MSLPHLYEWYSYSQKVEKTLKVMRALGVLSLLSMTKTELTKLHKIMKIDNIKVVGFYSCFEPETSIETTFSETEESSTKAASHKQR